MLHFQVSIIDSNSINGKNTNNRLLNPQNINIIMRIIGEKNETLKKMN